MACSPTITHIRTSSSRLQPMTLRKITPSLPGHPDRGRGDGEVLRADHLAEHATGGVRGRHQHRVEPRLGRRLHLQRAEQRVRRGVGTGDGDADPAQDRARSTRRTRRTRPARRPATAVWPGQVHHVGQAQHGHHGDDRRAQLDVGLAVRLSARPGGTFRITMRDQSRDDQQGAGRGQPVELELGRPPGRPRR